MKNFQSEAFSNLTQTNDTKERHFHSFILFFLLLFLYSRLNIIFNLKKITPLCTSLYRIFFTSYNLLLFLRQFSYFPSFCWSRRDKFIKSGLFYVRRRILWLNTFTLCHSITPSIFISISSSKSSAF